MLLSDSLNCFENIIVRPLPASRAAPFPSVLTAKRFDGIAGRMFKADQRDEAVRCQEKLLEISRCFPGGLLELLSKNYAQQTLVHAELQLLDYARRENMGFLDNDKYIGCSKPACYACYHYILALAPEYHTVIPPSHYKLYLGWRVPEISKHRGEAAAKARNNVMDKMNEVFRAHLIREINERGRRPFQFDSTTGVRTLPHDLQFRPAPIHENSATAFDDREVFRLASTEDEHVTLFNDHEAFRAAPIREDDSATSNADNEALRRMPTEKDDLVTSTDHYQKYRDDASSDSHCANPSVLEISDYDRVTRETKLSANPSIPCMTDSHTPISISILFSSPLSLYPITPAEHES